MTCRCDHPKSEHDHYRPGRDCGQCSCRRYRRRTPLAALLRRLRGVRW
jgi:hypothetical protein